jgi:hypothetical protein
MFIVILQIFLVYFCSFFSTYTCIYILFEGFFLEDIPVFTFIATYIYDIFTSVESLQSHMILTMSHWSSGLTCLLPATRVTGSNPLGGTYVKPGFSC